MKSLTSNLIAFLFLFTFLSFSAQATTYYVSATGNNYNSGTSIFNAWSSVDKVNSKVFLPGDIILFEGGKSFIGSLYFDQYDGGNASAPIKLASYGTGKATIKSSIAGGLFAYNTAGMHISNLIFEGAGRTINVNSGVYFYHDLPNKMLDNIVMDNLEVYGYQSSGIVVGTLDKTSGYLNFKVTNSSVHDNGSVGISTFSGGTITHKNFYIGHTKVFNNSGIAGYTSSHTGSGIILSGVDGATIEYCEAYNNGWLNAWTVGGPVGIWGYICNNLVIQYNESHHNKTGTTKDGGGFDLDGGVTNSVMQYNYSHDNDGAGYLLAQYVGAPAMKNLIIRYNISENDGRKNSNAGILLWATNSNGGIQNAEIYNNTIYLSPASSGSPIGVHVSSGYIYNTKIRNNIVQTTNGLQVVRAQNNTGVRFEGNAYWSTGAALKFYWTGTTYSTLEQWRAATGQEKINNEPVGFCINPELTEPGKGVTIGDPTKLATLAAYKLQPTSGVIGKGLNLTNNFGIEVGEVDFWNNKINQQESFSIGAHQVTQTSPSKIAQNITFNNLLPRVVGEKFTLEASSSSGLPVEFKLISGPATLNGATLITSGTGTVIVEAIQNGNEIYAAATTIRQSITVAKATQQIAFAALINRILGSAPFSLQAFASSGLPITYKIVSGPATLMGNMVTLNGTGQVTIAAMQAGSDSYLAAETVTQSFTVNNNILNQSINIKAITAAVYGDKIEIEATATSGLPVKYKVIAGPAILKDNKLEVTGIGTVELEVTQEGNETYAAAPIVKQTFAVNKANQTITFAAIPGKTFGDAPFSLVGNATSGLVVSYRVVSGPATVSGNNLTLTGAGTVTVEANQSGNSSYNMAPAVKQSFVVNKATSNISFNALVDKTTGNPSFELYANSTNTTTPITFTSSNPGVVSVSNATGKWVATILTAGTANITASQIGNTNYLAAADVVRTQVVKTAATILPVATVPASQKIEAEKYASMSGISTQKTTDVGGGINVDWIDANDWLTYNISVDAAGTYMFNFRVAGITDGQFEVRNSNGTVLQTVDVPVTGGWQKWTTVSAPIALNADSQTIQIYVKKGNWNLNWLEISKSATTTQTLSARSQFTEDLTLKNNANTSALVWSVYPNPTPDKVQVTVNNEIEGEVNINVMDATGKTIKQVSVQKTKEVITQTMSLENLDRGIYFIHLQAKGVKEVKKIIKQ